MPTTPCRPDGLPSTPSRCRPGWAALALALALLPALVLPLAAPVAAAATPAAARPAESTESAAEPGAAPARGAHAGDYLQAGSIAEVVSRWRPETHLYVLGDVGLDGDALAELAGWIGDRHWTVLLVADASGETYTDVDGRVRYGEEAVEYGGGQGIPRRRGFPAQVHPRTGEPDGVILTVVLAQRSLYYNAAEALDSRGLGEAAFTGGLDAWSIQALRERGDLGAAVRETIANVEARLEAAVAQELQAADAALARAGEQLDLLERRAGELAGTASGAVRRLSLPAAAGLRAEVASARSARDAGRAREAAQALDSVLARTGPALQALDALQRDLAAARAALPAATDAVAALEQRAAAFRRADPTLGGPLARPDVEALRQELAASGAAAGDDPGQAARAAEGVRARAQAQAQAIEQYPAAGEALAAAAVRLAGLEGRERAGSARERLLAARQALAEGRELHARGTPGYDEKLQAARQALDAAERQVAAADAAARLRRAVLLFLLALVALALAGTGLALNRRRRGAKQEAERLLADWRAALDKKLEALIDELEKRVARYVGPASGEGKRSFGGETLRLAEQIRADVGSLYILWTSASSVLERAAALIRAGGAGAFYNFFLPGRYRRGIALLRDEPVPFDPADGLPRVFGYERTWRDDLLGDLASYAPFAKSFQEIVAELNQRAARAAAALDAVQSSLVEGPAALDETEELIRRTAARREEIERAAGGEGLFRLPALFATALPAADAALGRARALFPTDPVAALAGEGALARRIALQAAQLAGIAGAARHGVLPAVEAGAAALGEHGIATGWIEAELRRLSAEADRLAELAEKAARAPAARTAAGTTGPAIPEAGAGTVAGKVESGLPTAGARAAAGVEHPPPDLAGLEKLAQGFAPLEKPSPDPARTEQPAQGLARIEEPTQDLARREQPPQGFPGLETFAQGLAGIEALAQGLAGIGVRVERAAGLARVLDGTARPEAARVAGLVEAARAELGAALGIPAERILREEGADPSERLADAARQAGAAQEALGRGDLAAAAAALDEAERLTAGAAALVEETRRAFTAQAAAVEERRAETERVAALVPEHERILAGVREAFAPGVLVLGDPDPRHPEANGTLADNAEEARAHVGFAREKLDRSGAAFLAGRLLGAARLLAEVEAHQELAVHRLQEIAERRERLARTVESNRDLLATLEARVREDQVAVAGDPRTMRPTVASFEQGRSRVEQARRAVEAAPGDPFRAEEELRAARALLDEVHDRMAPGDRALHAEAGSSLWTANQQLGAAGDLARRALADDIPDSPEITRAYRALEALTAAQAQAREALGTPHGDWKALDAEADRIAEEAARWAGTLSAELAAAEAAAEALSRAARSVRQAGAWRGAFGIVIGGQAGGRPGAGALSRASALLARGQYEGVRQEAESAYREAIAAIAAAEAELRVRRAEERRREAERQWHDSAGRGGGSGWGGGHSGGGWGGGGGGSGSGSSHSSWGGGSGSGSAKSGW